MKKTYFMIIIMITALTANAQTVLVQSINIQSLSGLSTISVNGGQLQMTASISPSNATNPAIRWSTTNVSGSVIIDPSGLLTAITDGTAIVQGFSTDGSGASDMMWIHISNQATTILVSSITVQGQGGVSTISAPAGRLQMEATVLPANSTDPSFTWSVSNGTGAATISQNGFLTAVSDGTVTVTATANDASGISGSTIVTISNQSVGIRESEEQNTLIGPNPASEYLIVTSKTNTKTILTIHTLSGHKILEGKIENKKEKINISDLTPGLYMITLKKPDGTIRSRKWVKQ